MLCIGHISVKLEGKTVVRVELIGSLETVFKLTGPWGSVPGALSPVVLLQAKQLYSPAHGDAGQGEQAPELSPTLQPTGGGPQLT